MTGRSEWTTQRDPERKLAQDAKAVGMLRSEYLLKRITGIHDEAVAKRWPSHQLDEAIHEVEQLANEVWGPL